MRLGARLSTVVVTLTTSLATAAALATPVAATAAPVADRPAKPRPPAAFPLPDGFQPEGIAVQGRFGYFGSRVDGDIYRANLATGRGKVVSQGPGTPSIGLKVGPRDRLYVAGGDAGTVRIVSARTGKILRSLRLNTAESFVNDVVITPRAAWFTDSRAAQLYRVPIHRDGRLPRRADVRTLRLRGDWVQPPAGTNGANGITTTVRGRGLVVVNGTDGTLFRVPTTGARRGVARLVDLRGATVTNGDGLLREGRRLYVVRNRANLVAVLRLARDSRAARQVRTLTSPAFDVPTTVARWRDALYLPNARFTTEPTPTTPYDVVRVRDPR
ncbi:superoxide dismutase [Nocardioides litoris]|uniref:superoxide dismutase n=1 Tax=Nocardioides litoris TaxID=1926648 RepID=UPI0011248E26|nr:superoxide dismutase [Nocardioides litoris]